MTLSKGKSMLGRGVKRKWSCLEELEAEMVTEKEKSGPEVPAAGGVGGGVMAAWRSGPDAVRLQQRQRVLGLCLQKLQHYQAGVELSLRRSVLLINTLRQIQDDMQSDGVDACAPDLLLGGVHATDGGGGGGGRLLRDDLMDDMPAVTCPGCTEEEDGDGDVDGLSPPPSPELAAQEPDVSPAEAAAAVGAFSDAVNAMGYLSDLALDDIFEDIDTSMYETSDLPAAWSAGSLWPVSVSLWADEDVKMRPSGHAAAAAAAGSLQSCLMDLNELDHIMEILVKS